MYYILPHYLIKGKIFGGENIVIEHKTCVLICSTVLFEIFLILRQRDIIVIVQRSSCEGKGKGKMPLVQALR